SHDALEQARLQVDIITGTAPLGRGYWLFDALAVPGIHEMLAINPGVEGVGAQLATDGRPTLLLPHELVTAKLLAAKRPSAALPDFAMGMDLAKIRTLLASRAGRLQGRKPTDPPFDFPMFRFRTDTFVELRDHTAAPVALYRGIPPAPKLDAKVLREAALAGGRYLVAHLGKNGRYIYNHDVATGTQTDPNRVNGEYSMPRHAGTTYFLAELYRITKADWLKEPIERAFAHLAELLANGRCTTTLPSGIAIDCVMDKSEQLASLGSTALAVVALAEYQRATGDTRYLPLATKFASFILWMQRPDGSFRHLYDPKTKLYDDKTELLYYSGEAALALARMHVITEDKRYAVGAEKALDWLVGWYDFFMGGFFYGEEHWTCIASEAIWPTVSKPSYMDFCHGYGAFLRDQQSAVGEHPDEDDLAGAYNVTPFITPYNTPAGSRTEAMISAYLLGRHRKAPDLAVREQIRAALAYVIGQQIRPESDFNVVGSADGGMPGSPIDRNVRIDYVQHVCSAMIRASEWIDEP
ncbi:MAG: hypothetical protein H0T79_15265, partial [Deltaproteobacteria bacterium]|nr:hypothetical protein [Deltaproteobacteria bacterium]